MNKIYDVAFIGVLLFLLLVYIFIDIIRNGKKNFVRRIFFYSFIFYLVIVAKLTLGAILPRAHFLEMNEPPTQLVPFYFVKEFYLRYRYVGIE